MTLWGEGNFETSGGLNDSFSAGKGGWVGSEGLKGKIVPLIRDFYKMYNFYKILKYYAKNHQEKILNSKDY